jgi:hypothetical protein
MSEQKRSARLLRFAPFIIVAGFLLYVVARLPPGEPRYGGKPLHYWLACKHDPAASPRQGA